MARSENTRKTRPNRVYQSEQTIVTPVPRLSERNLKPIKEDKYSIPDSRKENKKEQFDPKWKVANPVLPDLPSKKLGPEAPQDDNRLDAYSSLPGGYLTTDGRGIIREIDHQTAVLFRSSGHRLIGKPFLLYIHPKDRANFRAHLVQLRQVNQVLEFTTTVQLKNNINFPSLLTATSTNVDSKATTSIRWLVRDISSNPFVAKNTIGTPKELEERVVERTRELMIANKLLALEIENREKAEQELRKTHEELEIRVKDRTAQLAVTNERLKQELAERQRAEYAAAQRARELSALNLANTTLHTTLDLQNLLGKILDAATSAIPAGEKGMLHLIAKDTGQLEMRAMIGYTDSRIQKFNYAGSKGYVAKSVRYHTPMLFNDIPHDPEIRYEGTIPEVRAIQSAIVTPLIINNEVIGALSLDSAQKGAFTEDDLRLLTSFAGTVTAAIRNAQLHAEVQRIALTDAVTNIYNRRGFFEIGKREIERSHRFGRPLSAIMFDIDYFKEINDQHSHAVGDRILRSIADRIGKNIREIDVFGRYGGDEFTILLPETDLFLATNIAERLRECMVQSQFNVEDVVVRVTISLGVAKATADTFDLASLLDRADTALYAAKQAGRNRVEVG